MTNQESNNNCEKTRHTFSSNYSIAILSKIYQGFRPIQIAKHFGVSPQLIKYHMDKLDDLNLIEKIGNRQGISWVLTEKGSSF
ncbi:MAG: hypothetical protein ACRD8Z_19020 [Nitrososphaeraceae archaeon]